MTKIKFPGIAVKIICLANMHNLGFLRGGIMPG